MINWEYRGSFSYSLRACVVLGWPGSAGKGGSSTTTVVSTRTCDALRRRVENSASVSLLICPP